MHVLVKLLNESPFHKPVQQEGKTGQRRRQGNQEERRDSIDQRHALNLIAGRGIEHVTAPAPRLNDARAVRLQLPPQLLDMHFQCVR